MKKIIAFNIKSAIGSFIKPTANNNHLTFSIIPKPTLMGIIGAVIGMERKTMEETNAYPILTKNIKYAVVLKKPFEKKFWSEYAYNNKNAIDGASKPSYTPAYFERIYNVDYDIYLLYDNENNDISNILNNFVDNIKNNSSVFPVYMGMANFFADIEYINTFNAPEPKNGEFSANCIVENIALSEDQPFDYIRTDKIPVESVGRIAYNHKNYKTIYFHDNCGTFKAIGQYYTVNNQNLQFI